MPPEIVDASAFSHDIQDFIRSLHEHDVRFMIVGGEAVIFYGHIRVTGDIDVFYDRELENTERLYNALTDFWHGEIPGLPDHTELTKAGVIFQFGVPPNRIDLLNDIDGIEFESAWSGRTRVVLGGPSGTIPFSYIGLEDLIRNKRASGRPRDEEDLAFLIRALE